MAARQIEELDITGITADKLSQRGRPAVLKGLAGHWEAVQKSKESFNSFVQYLAEQDSGKETFAALAAPDIGGRFSYNQAFDGVNFQRTRGTITQIAHHLLKHRGNRNAPAVALQAANVREVLPQFESQNQLSIVDEKVEPTLWMCNKAIVAPHFDIHENIAVVTCGQRRFTLFPPEQIHNLYLGPALSSPGGVPISTVDVRNPDLDAYPDFQQAIDNSFVAELEPGDAIYIPTLWWHAVESLSDLHALINYWWAGTNESGISPENSLWHAVLSIASLTEPQRKAWKTYFNYYVFDRKDEHTSHLPENLNDVVTIMTDEQKRALLARLKADLE